MSVNLRQRLLLTYPILDSNIVFVIAGISLPAVNMCSTQWGVHFSTFPCRDVASFTV